MARMTPDEIDTILRTPLIAFIATIRPDMTPHVTPVWYIYDGDLVHVAADSNRSRYATSAATLGHRSASSIQTTNRDGYRSMAR